MILIDDSCFQFSSIFFLLLCRRRSSPLRESRQDQSTIIVFIVTFIGRLCRLLTPFMPYIMNTIMCQLIHLQVDKHCQRMVVLPGQLNIKFISNLTLHRLFSFSLFHFSLDRLNSVSYLSDVFALSLSLSSLLKRILSFVW